MITLPTFGERTKLLLTFAAYFGVLVLLTAIVWFIFIRPARNAEDAALARTGQVIAEGQAKAASDAQVVVIDTSKKEVDRGQLDATNEAAIRSGDPGAGRRALCLRDAYRADPTCQQLLHPHP